MKEMLLRRPRAAKGSCSRRSSSPRRSRAPASGCRASRSSRPSAAARRSRPSCAGTARRSTAATRCSDCDVLVVVSPSPPSPRLRCASVRPGGLVVLNRETRFPLAGPFERRARPGLADRAGARDPLRRGPAAGERGRARRLRAAAPSRRARAPGAGGRARALGAPPSRTSPRRATATRAARGSTRLPATRRVEPAPAPRRRRRRPRFAGEHDRLPRHPHRHLVAERPALSTRAPPAPSARSSARRARSRGATARWSSTPPLQGLRHLRGRLPCPRTRSRWRRCTA